MNETDVVKKCILSFDFQCISELSRILGLSHALLIVSVERSFDSISDISE